MLARTSRYLQNWAKWRDSGTWFFHCSAKTLNEFGLHEPLLLSDITVCPKHLLDYGARWVGNLAEVTSCVFNEISDMAILFPTVCLKQNRTNIHWCNDLRHYLTMQHRRWLSHSSALMFFIKLGPTRVQIHSKTQFVSTEIQSLTYQIQHNECCLDMVHDSE
jgi:hypothetical protein